MSLLESPYKGLESFEDSDHDARLFFGREREREIIVANLLASKLTVLYGDTGVGKSSVLRAGVARDLRALPEPLAVVVFDEWQDDPAGALQARVAAATGAESQGRLADTLELGAAMEGGEVFVVLDGFEEEFLYHGFDASPDSFFDQFSEAVTRPGLRASFLVAVREDALAKLDRFKSRVPNVFGNYLRLPHLDRTAAREAIVGPVDRYNESADEPVVGEPALVEAVLDQVTAGKVELGRAGRGAVDADGSQAGIEAPYLQLVMERLWEAEAQAGSNLLRLETFERLGGAGQIVRDHLDRALEALEPGQRDVAAAVFNHLVTPSGAKIAHDASDLAGYVGVPSSEVAPVLSALAAQRILRSVPGVRGSDQPRFEIYHDILADPVLAWRTRHESEREVERVRETAHKRHRRLLLVAAGAILLAGAMAGVTIFALTQRSEADAQALRARARAFEQSSSIQLSLDPELSLLLAVEAAKLDRGRRAEDMLRQALLAARERRVFPARDEVTVARFLGGGRIVVAGRDGFGRVYDTRARTRRPLFKLREGAAITSGDVDPRGTVIAMGDESGNVKLWSARDGSPVSTFSCGAPVRTVAFDPTAGRIVAACGRTVVVWSVGSTRPRWTHDLGWPVTDAIFGPASGPFGDSVAVIGHDPRVVLLDGATGSERKTFSEGGPAVTSVAFSPGGGYLAAGGTTSVNVRIWNLRTGTSTELPDTPAIDALAFTANGAILGTASLDGTGRTWIVSSGARYGSMSGHTGGVTGISFSRDGKFVLTASSDRTARIWTNSDSPDMVAVLAGHKGAVNAASFSRNGKEVLTGSVDHTGRLWDASQPTLTAKPRGTLASPTPAGAERIAPNGKVLAVPVGTRVKLFSVPGRHPLGTLSQRAKVTAIAFSADGKRVATGGADGTAVIWDTHTGRPIRTLTAGRALLMAVAFSPNGRHVVTAGADHDARVWNADNGMLEHVLHWHFSAVRDAQFSPDGRWIATISAQSGQLWRVGADGPLFQFGIAQPGTGKSFVRLTTVAFDPTSRVVLTTAEDGVVRTYTCDVCGGIDDMLRLARARLAITGRTLTRAERKQYGG